ASLSLRPAAAPSGREPIRLRASTDARQGRPRCRSGRHPTPCADMRTSYAVVWREGELPQGTGKLEPLRRALRLDGVSGNEGVVLDVPYDELAGLRVGHSKEERIAGSTALVLERRCQPTIRIASFGQPNLISEIAERVTSIELGGAAVRRTAVIVPIEPGTHETVRALVAQGPPFDP